MVVIMHQQQQQQQVPQLNNNPQSSSSSLRSPPSAAPLPLPLSQLPSLPPDHVIAPVLPIASTACPLPRVRLSDIALYDGASAPSYLRAVEALSGSLMRHNAALIELGCHDTALMRCGLEASRLFFRSSAHLAAGGNPTRGGVHMYRAGRFTSFSLHMSTKFLMLLFLIFLIHYSRFIQPPTLAPCSLVVLVFNSLDLS